MNVLISWKGLFHIFFYFDPGQLKIKRAFSLVSSLVLFSQAIRLEFFKNFSWLSFLVSCYMTLNMILKISLLFSFLINRPILLNCNSFKLQILQLLLSLLWNFSRFKKPTDPLLTSRWSLLKCLSFKKKFDPEKGILSELDPKQDSGFSLNLQISDFK